MSHAVYRAATALGRAGLRALDLRVEWTGADHLPVSGPVLLASNHVSYPDFVFVAHAGLARGRTVRFLCRHDVWNRRRWAWPMDRMRHVPVDRQAPASAYLLARSRLLEGDAVCLFPEAGISWSFTVRPLMRGVASLARETGAPVVPVAIWGSQRLWSVGRPDHLGREPRPDWTRGRRVDLAFGEPMAPPGEDLTAWTRELGVRLTAQLEALQRLPHHRPRPGEWAPWYPAHLGGDAMTVAEARDWDDYPRSAVPVAWGPSVAPDPGPGGADDAAG